MCLSDNVSYLLQQKNCSKRRLAVQIYCLFCFMTVFFLQFSYIYQMCCNLRFLLSFHERTFFSTVVVDKFPYYSIDVLSFQRENFRKRILFFLLYLLLKVRHFATAKTKTLLSSTSTKMHLRVPMIRKRA